MSETSNLESLLNALAKMVAAKVRESLDEAGPGAAQRRLLTVDQAAAYIGRSEEAMQHLVANGKVPTVRIDRRVSVDVKDLDKLIEDHKIGASR